ncbi:hypothetical protein TRFO_31773 [Tritrichomonas foetus]|uniref:Uncharacterized protein n=1 Tax=Tritrichomonas foetus TaxID=1144522 RepID=A0A1J4JV90_9EUKA|nr:hypothetical protein TRFO_31773 [Tritrichomonas foetus]|eukprot:OHT01444.1 hypothetical protein TRFO_31773 [Tritrichomonas foetus]
MEQSLRLLLTEGTQLNEQTLLNVFNKLNSNGRTTFASDLYILTAERLFDLPPPLPKHIVDKADTMITIYNRLQEPTNQFQIRAMICQALINSHLAKQQRGIPATELNLKAVDFMFRAFKIIQSNTLYVPLSLRASFIFYQIAFPFFITEQRHHLSQITPLVVSLLEPHLTGKFDQILRLYIAVSLLHCCILDDFLKCDEASKHMQKLMTLVPTDLIQLRYSLLHLYAHFSRKSSSGLFKQKLDLNEQLQKAVIMYQTARSNNATTTKDLGEVLKTCLAFLETKKEPNEETYEAEIIIGETGRLAAQFNQPQVAEECHAKASSARSPIARIHALLITAELSLTKQLPPNERAEIINSCNHAMSLAMFQGDLVTVQDAAALLWSHSVQMLEHAGLIKRYLIGACDILNKVHSQANLLRSQIHFALAKIFESEHDTLKALDNLKKALALDYLWSDHPTKLIHPFDRFIVPFHRMLNVMVDSYGQQTTIADEAHAQIALPKKINPQSLDKAYKLIQSISSGDISMYDAIEAAHFASVYFEIIKNASQYGSHQIAVDACHQFLLNDFDGTIFDAAVEIQCEATVYGVASCFKINPVNSTYAIQFVQFSIARSKLLKLNRLAYNTISSIWNSFFSLQDPADCSEYTDFILDCVTNLFESTFPKSKELIGQYVNLFVQVVMASSNEPVPATSPKKKGPSLDPAKQKLLKSAEDLLIKSLPIVTSVYEKKALVDRLVDIFAKRNALPPNQNDPELSVLVTLATIMNEKVQHKSETLTTVFNQIQQLKQPILYSLLSEKACKLDLHQISIDSASKALEIITNPKGKDELYHCALAHFYRGLSYLKLIQPDLQEFSCQDKLRVDSASDFLRAAVHFNDSKSTNNAKLSLSYFVSTISVGENFPKFRSFLSSLLVEAIQISRKVNIGDELRVRLFRIYLLVLIDQKDWVTCRKIIQQAISQLDKNVHGNIWELLLIVAFNADCSKSQQPLIDEMLRVKQLGDAKYQSKLWTFVADLATDPNIQKTALTKAIDVLKPENTEEKFRTYMNFARWLHQHNHDWKEIEEAINHAEDSIKGDSPEKVIEFTIETASFRLESTTDIDTFNQICENIVELGNSLWILTEGVNSPTPDEDEQNLQNTQSKETQKPRSSSRGKGAPHKSQSNVKAEDFIEEPTNIEEWLHAFQSIEKYKSFQPVNTYLFISNLIKIVDIMDNLGYEYQLMKLWYHILLFTKHSLEWPRFEQFVYMKLKLFLDKLNVISPIPYSNEFLITEEEKSEWDQKVGRYQADPPSNFPPLRKLLNKQASVLIKLGEYKSALYLLNTSLNQSEQLGDRVTSAEATLLVATIRARSGESQTTIDLLTKAAQVMKGNLEFWVDWYSTTFSVESSTSDFVENLFTSFQQNCLQDKQLSINETLSLYRLYRNAASNLTPDAAGYFYDNVLKGNLLPSSKFLPTIDTILCFFWKALLSPKFPRNLHHFREFGHEVLDLVNVTSDLYNKKLDIDEQTALPMLCRFVDSVNLFGYLALKYSPVIRNYEEKGLDISSLGSHESLLNEFIDKSQEPFPDLSPTAAVMHFNNVKNIDCIPKKYAVKMNVYLGQCLHAISTDNVSLQSAVRYLWAGNNLLTELREYDLTGEIAQELFEILKTSDLPGALFQFLIAQSVRAYRMRIKLLLTECPPTNRERLFVQEAQRLREAFLNPQISQMFQASQKYFETIPNGTTLVRLGRTMDEIRNWVSTNKNCLILVIDNLSDSEDSDTEVNVSSIQLGQPPTTLDTFNTIKLQINIDEIAMRYEIFQQIISTANADASNSNNNGNTNNGNASNTGTNTKPPLSPSSKSKGKQAAKRTQSKAAVSAPKNDEKNPNFAKEAMKLNHPEFVKFIHDLNEKFQPISSILPEGCPDSVLILSSLSNAHEIPYECLEPFSQFQTIFHDFSIMSALNRKSPNTTKPEFGESN